MTLCLKALISKIESYGFKKVVDIVDNQDIFNYN